MMGEDHMKQLSKLLKMLATDVDKRVYCDGCTLATKKQGEVSICELGADPCDLDRPCRYILDDMIARIDTRLADIERARNTSTQKDGA